MLSNFDKGPLSESQLKVIDANLDSGISSIPLLTRDFDLAILHVLRQIQVRVRERASQKLQVALEKTASDFCFWWISKHCERSSSILSLKHDGILIREANDILEQARNYSLIWDMFSMCFSKPKLPAIAVASLDQLISISSNNKTENAKAAADFLTSSAETSDYKDLLELTKSFIQRNKASIIEEAKFTSKSLTRIDYEFPEQFARKLTVLMYSVYEAIWLLDDDWDCGGYSVKQYRWFWSGLLAISILHDLCVWFARNVYFESLVPVRSFPCWIHLLKSITGLSESCLKMMLEDFTFDDSKFKRADDIYSGPFFKLSSESLILNIAGVKTTNPDVLLWRTIESRRKTIHNSLSNKKEKLQIADLRAAFYMHKDESCQLFDRIETGETDIDLLVIDKNDKFGLILQLKWVVPPHWLKNMQTVCEELEDGISQSKKALAWINKRDPSLQERLSISKEELEQLEFQSLVVGKHSMGMGRIANTEIPVINETILRWYLFEKSVSLRNFWQCCQENKYYAVENEHFSLGDMNAEFNDIQIMGRGISVNYLVDKLSPAYLRV